MFHSVNVPFFPVAGVGHENTSDHLLRQVAINGIHWREHVALGKGGGGKRGGGKEEDWREERGRKEREERRGNEGGKGRRREGGSEEKRERRNGEREGVRG